MNKKNDTPNELSKADDELLEPKKILGINWYPGHMARAIREIKERLNLVDIVLEIRDARVPLASGNNALNETLRQKSHLIILNKAGMADAQSIQQWTEWFKAQGTPFVFVDCFDKASMKKVIPMARQIVDQKRRASNPEKEVQKKKLRLMIIGLPNTGKSTVINQLAKRSATKTADRPGHTQVQQWIMIDQDLDLLDTPGVMPPCLDSDEHGLWLSSIHAIPDDIVGEERPAKFLIEFFREKNSQEFKERYKLESNDLSTEEILEKIAVLRGCVKQKGLPDFERVYKLILNDFRNGELGKCCFSAPPQLS
jgi:ribosome biogenesis GTPase A